MITAIASVFVLVVMGWRASLEPDSATSFTIELDADVTFTGLSFTIRNRSAVDWTT